MAFAQGADQFAIQSYSQAVALDPTAPDLRLSLGGVYYALGDYESAIDAFKMAVLTKPDYANARYNLAIAYREKGEIKKAISEMTTVLSLLDPNSQDYQTAKNELEALEAKKPAVEETAAEATPESLTTPQPSTAPVVEPPIKLPEDANPPVSETSPAPSFSPNPSPAF
jgi:tetratricopeptide (TPR) repeat protein